MLGAMPTLDELNAEAAKFRWFQQIDLGHGVVTPGPPLPWGPEHFPPLKGKTVLDIGAWDGAYSFLAETEGASRVVALDSYAWGVDMAARAVYWDSCVQEGVLPDHRRDTTDFWDDSLPGKRPFDFAHRVLGSHVETALADFTTCDLDALGTFDVVLFLGVLYHMLEPLTSLQRVRAVTGDVAAVASVALDIPDMNDKRLLQFQPGNELAGDFGNWYLPTISALQSLCLAAGFARAEVIVGPADHGPNAQSSVYLAMVHAYVT
jgi:tRNA (mo5U34)-methyltransferase